MYVYSPDKIKICGFLVLLSSLSEVGLYLYFFQRSILFLPYAYRKRGWVPKLCCFQLLLLLQPSLKLTVEGMTERKKEGTRKTNRMRTDVRKSFSAFWPHSLFLFLTRAGLPHKSTLWVRVCFPSLGNTAADFFWIAQPFSCKAKVPMQGSSWGFDCC